MKKKSVLERIRYRLDRLMSRGAISMSLLLFAVTAALVAVIGIVAYLVSGEGSVVYQIWNSLMHTLDAGNLAGVPADNLLYLILMFLATPLRPVSHQCSGRYYRHRCGGKTPGSAEGHFRGAGEEPHCGDGL